ncbi:hypothetical protein DFQ30_005734 [Apophysomyces sp. BC1015]|nr:hypothetical protein DFQ30_005734 [Apophysomyces sp. BC1015]KAG0177323.1 hypothetical protein DFQ29_004968 [Apophysomyces sp. BC1021]
MLHCHRFWWSIALLACLTPSNSALTIAINDISGASLSFGPSIDAFVLTNTLCEYYENIVDQVMETITDEILTSAAHSSRTIQRLDRPLHDRCSISLDMFMNTLENQLYDVRSDLLASIRPLVEVHLPPSFPDSFPTDDASPLPRMIADLTRDVNILNRRMGFELGQVINAEETTGIILRQSMPRCSAAIRFTRQKYVYFDEYHKTTTWLRSRLERIHRVLHIEFDARIKDAIQSITEDFLIDEY